MTNSPPHNKLEGAFWAHVEKNCPYYTRTKEFSEWMTRNSTFEYEGVQWIRTASRHRGFSGDRFRWFSTFASMDDGTLVEHPVLLERKSAETVNSDIRGNTEIGSSSELTSDSDNMCKANVAAQGLTEEQLETVKFQRFIKHLKIPKNFLITTDYGWVIRPDINEYVKRNKQQAIINWLVVIAAFCIFMFWLDSR